MKIKYNKKTFPYYIMFIVIFVVECHYFDLFKLPDILEFIIYTNRAKWIAPLGAIVAFLCWRNHSNIIRNYKRFFSRYFLMLTTSLLLVSIYTTVAYPLNPVITTYGFCCPYLYVFWAIPMLYVFEIDGLEGIMKLLNIICIGMLVVAILQGISYMITGSLLFANSEDTYISVRDGKVRYGVGPFTGIMLVYNVYRLYTNSSCSRDERKRIYVFMLLWGIYTILNGQTRMMLITEILCCCVIFILGKTGSLKKILLIFTIMISATYFIGSGIMDNVISGFSKTGQNAGSTIARIEAITYYLNSFLKNPLFAISFAGDENYFTLVHGMGSTIFQTNNVWYDYSDIGIIGELAKLGLFIIPILFWPAYRMVKISKLYCLWIKNSETCFVCSLCVYVLITSFTLMLTDNSRVIAFPIVFSFFEYYRAHVRG